MALGLWGLGWGLLLGIIARPRPIPVPPVVDESPNTTESDSTEAESEEIEMKEATPCA